MGVAQGGEREPARSRDQPQQRRHRHTGGPVSRGGSLQGKSSMESGFYSKNNMRRERSAPSIHSCTAATELEAGTQQAAGRDARGNPHLLSLLPNSLQSLPPPQNKVRTPQQGRLRPSYPVPLLPLSTPAIPLPLTQCCLCLPG